MTDISGFGLQINVKASTTFPTGFVVSQFADDADPFDLPDMTIAESAMGMNGDLVTWNTANPITINLSVVPGSEDDKNLATLFEANRVGKGKQSAKDVITMTAVYADGKTLTLSQGVITNGNPGDSIASAGRKKSKTYGFVFENKATS